jgi:hypothetical protein
MTWPINVIEELREAELTGNKSSIESLSKVDYLSLLHAQRSYKKSLLKNGQFIKTLVRILVPRLEKGFRDRNTRDENVISLVLHVWRNLCAIKDKTASTYHSADAVEEATLQVRALSLRTFLYHCKLIVLFLFSTLVLLALRLFGLYLPPFIHHSLSLSFSTLFPLSPPLSSSLHRPLCPTLILW